MKAIAVLKNLPLEDPACFAEIEIPEPLLKSRDLLVRVQAISVNPIDFKVRRRPFGPQEGPRILGWDVAGVVEKTGIEVASFKVGDEVFYSGDVTRPGANSELHAVDERIVGKKPNSWNFADAAALPLTAVTAWEALFERLEIKRYVTGRKPGLLVIGAAGGVGSIAIQLARLAGVQVIATASRPETQEWWRKMGADLVVSHRGLLVSSLASSGITAVDYIFNCAGIDEYWAAMAELIVPQGKICGLVNCEKPLDLNLLKQKSATFVWEFMSTRSLFQTADMAEQGKILAGLSALADEGKIRSTLTKTFDGITPENLRQAHLLLESGRSIGKLVLVR